MKKNYLMVLEALVASNLGFTSKAEVSASIFQIASSSLKAFAIFAEFSICFLFIAFLAFMVAANSAGCRLRCIHKPVVVPPVVLNFFPQSLQTPYSWSLAVSTCLWNTFQIGWADSTAHLCNFGFSSTKSFSHSAECSFSCVFEMKTRSQDEHSKLNFVSRSSPKYWWLDIWCSRRAGSLLE